MKFLGAKVPYVHWGEFIVRVLDCIVTTAFGVDLHCGCFNLICNVMVSLCGGVLASVWVLW